MTVAHEQAFEELVAPHRDLLMAHCYRLLGSLQDAEDAQQETLLRAWRGISRFQGRAALRSWLYTIATNVCLAMLERRPARMLRLDEAPTPAGEGPGAPLLDTVWIDPYPDPDALLELRESVELSFVAALQHLLPRQRAVLILREVLGFSAAETADALDTTVAGVNSALQRARATIDARLPQRVAQAAPDDEAIRQLVAEFAAAWERADVPAVVRLLTDDVVIEMPPVANWYRGRADVEWFLRDRPLAHERRWHNVITHANGAPAVAHYLFDDATGGHVAHSIVVLTLRDGRIARMSAFLSPSLFGRFGLPERI